MDTSAPALQPNIADLLLDAVFLVDAGGRVVYVNAACERILGYTPAELIGRTLIDFVVPEDRARTLEEAKHVMAGRPRIGFENRYIRKDGRQAHIMWSASWSQADQMRIGVARDVTERKHAEEMQAALYAVSEAAHAATDLRAMYREMHRIVAKLVPLAGFVVATCDPRTKQLGFAYQMDLHGNSPIIQEAATRRYCIEVICSGQPLLLADDLLITLPVENATSGSGTCLVLPLITRQEAIGALVLKSLPGTTYSDKEKELLQFVSAQVATAMERKRLSGELLRAARHDELTGLPNRRLFHDRMASALARCKRKQERLALLYLDIDDFKLVNDSLGHAAGDLLLQEVAQRLARCVREEDTVARLGGDEFVVLLEEVREPNDVSHIADKIRGAVQQPVHIDGLVWQTRTSIGTALYPEHGAEAEELIKHADKAMYRDKRSKARVFK